MRKRYLMFTACLFSALMSWGQAKLSPYTVNALASAGVARMAQEGELSAYVVVDDAADRNEIEALGVMINLDMGDMLTVRMPMRLVEKLAHVRGVKYISASKVARPMLVEGREAAGVTAMFDDASLHGLCRGYGVVVGIIDAGFDYTHPAFLIDDGGECRIRRVWEQATDEAPSIEGAARPNMFGYGMEFDTPGEIYAAASDREGNTHGTHVAGIAVGGKAVTDTYYGVASEADIILVSYGDMQTGNVNITDAIAYIYAYAESVGKPCVINMSLGNQMGPHDGSSLFDTVADKMQGEGRLLVASAGNFGAYKLHASNKGDGEVKTIIDYVKAPSNVDVGGDIDIWGECGASLTVRVDVINKLSGVVIDSSEEVMTTEDNINMVYTPASPTRGTINIATEVNPINGKPHVLVSSGITSLRSSNLIAVSVTPSKGMVDMWADGTKVLLTDRNLEGYTDGDSECTLAEIGGTGKRVISVGAFVSSKNANQAFADDELGGIASFSSRGPSVDGRMKPDVTAPGTYIVSAFSSYVTPTLGSVVESDVWDGRAYNYACMEGTSMAAPFVTGIVASWLELCPSLTPEDLIEVLRQTSVADEHTSESLPDNGVWGYGKVNAHKGATYLKSIADGIDENADDDMAKDEVFDLNGRQVQTPSHGVYIVKNKSRDKSRIYKKVF